MFAKEDSMWRALLWWLCRAGALSAMLALAACAGAPTNPVIDLPTTNAAPSQPVPTSVIPTAVISTSSRRPLLGEPFSIQGGETMFVDLLAGSNGNTTPLQLRFDAVLKDERCPKLVACVVRGDAVISIVAQIDQAGQPQTLQLHTDPSLDQSHMLYQGYNISLTALEPTVDRPGDSLALSSYMATLTVTNTAAAPPTVLPTPSAAPTPPTAFDACVLAESATIATLVGPIQATPVSSAIPAHSGQQCVIQAERAAVTLQLYLGDTATAQAIIADAQQAGTRFSELSNSTASVSAFGENPQHAVLVQQSNEAIFLIEIAFNSQSAPSDHEQAHANLATLQTMMLLRYIGVQAGQITLPTPQATP